MDFTLFLQKVLELHSSFLTELAESAKYDSRAITALPSVLFFTFSFLATHSIVHRQTYCHTSFSIYLYRELGFQWIFFHLLRLWLIFVNMCQWTSAWFNESFEVARSQGEEFWLNQAHVEASIFTLLLCISLVPLVYFLFSWFWKATIPNFLIWVGEDPLIRTEIGISGHYLERPPNFERHVPKVSKEMLRSLSAQYCKRPKQKFQPRRCRSLETFKIRQRLRFSN